MADYRLLKDRADYLLKTFRIKPAELARRAGVKPSSVSDWLSGKTKSLKSPVVMRLSESFGIPAAWIAGGVGSPELRPIKVLNADQKPVEDDPWIEIPDYYEIEFGCGPGMIDPSYDQEHAVAKRAYQRSWFRKHGYRPEALMTVRVSGNSMEPTLWDGDSATINMDDKERIKDNNIYAFKLNGELLIKRLFRNRINGDISIISDNRDKYAPMVLHSDDESNTLQIIGAVIDHSGHGGFYS